MDRLSSRFSIGNRLARLSSNWGLPDALARLGLADPSAPLHPGSHLGPPHPSPVAEEGSVGQEAGQAAGDRLQAGRQQQQKEQQQKQEPQQQQQQQQQMRQPSKALEPIQSAVNSQRLQRRPAQQHNQSAASSEAKLLSGSVLLEQGANNVNGNGNVDATTTRQTAADDGHGNGDGNGHDDDNGDGSVSTAKQTAADHTRLEAPASSSPPTGRAALASLGNAQSSPFQGELQHPARQTVCTQPGILNLDHYSGRSMR